jgi:hypothetical protein
LIIAVPYYSFSVFQKKCISEQKPNNMAGLVCFGTQRLSVILNSKKRDYTR